MRRRYFFFTFLTGATHAPIPSSNVDACSVARHTCTYEAHSGPTYNFTPGVQNSGTRCAVDLFKFMRVFSSRPQPRPGFSTRAGQAISRAISEVNGRGARKVSERDRILMGPSQPPDTLLHGEGPSQALALLLTFRLCIRHVLSAHKKKKKKERRELDQNCARKKVIQRVQRKDSALAGTAPPSLWMHWQCEDVRCAIVRPCSRPGETCHGRLC